jgi:hypothetical protein
MSRPYTVADHLFGAFFDNADTYKCLDCGLTTEFRLGPVNWLIWLAHDLTVGWGPKHWSHYEW